MTKGEQLKKDLKLSNFGSVRIAKLFITPRPVYYIWYDSRKPNFPITTYRIKSKPFVSVLFDGRRGFKTLPKMLPIRDLEDWDGDITNSLFITVDLSGKQFIKQGVFESVGNSNTIEEGVIISLKEFTTIPDLKKNSLSDRNKHFYQIRKKDGTTGSIFQTAEWSDDTDSVLVTFHVRPTYDKKVDTYTPTLKRKTDNKYTIKLEFLNASDFLGSKENFIEQKKGIQQKRVRKMLKEGLVRIWENDPSFFFQGSFETFAKVDGTIYPYTGPKGKGIWNRRHDPAGGDKDFLHLTKHLVELLIALNFNAPDITIALRNQIGE